MSLHDELYSKVGCKFEYSYLSLNKKFYSLLSAQKPKKAETVLFNERLAKELALDLTTKEFAELFSGNICPKKSFAQSYAGHQFGYFTMLGDGRALVLGEHTKPDNTVVDIQLKGSGVTPYSRGGDGKGPLQPMLREYIMSEAMHYLGIPTTRSLGVVTTGHKVLREGEQIGAVLTRVASSHLRVGTFEFASRFLTEKELQELFVYACKRHYQKDIDVFSFFEQVMNKQITLIISWMRVGFIHGVMNTDNMTISGETIDYGPCAFMDEYNPQACFSYIDEHKRYAFANQKNILFWNLARLAEALLALTKKDFSEDEAIKKFNDLLEKGEQQFREEWLVMMRKKIALITQQEDDEKLIFELLNIMQEEQLDYTNTFRNLQEITTSTHSIALKEWTNKWTQRLALENKTQEEHKRLMDSVNPAIIPRNHVVNTLLQEAEQGKYDLLKEFLNIIKNPYSDCVDSRFTQAPKEDERVENTFCGT